MKKLIGLIVVCLSVCACSENTTEPENNLSQPLASAEQPAEVSQKQDTLPNTENFLDFESIGGLKLTMSFDQTAASLGKWVAGPSDLWGADGLYHQSRYLKSKDLELNLVAKDSLMSNPQIFSVTLGPGGTMRTDRNIGIGSTHEEVMAAYGNVINREGSGDSTLVAGSIYGGMIFTLSNKKVSQIFLGAAAE